MNVALFLLLALSLLVGGCANRSEETITGVYTDPVPIVPPPQAAEAQPTPAPAVQPTPTLPVQPTPAPEPPVRTREQKLADLLREYRAGTVTSQQYQEQRAKILAEK